jgi:hypothetical protein
VDQQRVHLACFLSWGVQDITLVGDALDPGVISLKVGYSVHVAYLSFHHSLQRPARDTVLEVLHTFSGNGLQFAVLWWWFWMLVLVRTYEITSNFVVMKTGVHRECATNQCRNCIIWFYGWPCDKVKPFVENFKWPSTEDLGCSLQFQKMTFIFYESIECSSHLLESPMWV